MGLPGTTARCGPVTLAEALAVQRALAAAFGPGYDGRAEAMLDWAAAASHLAVSLTPILPEEPSDCTIRGLT